MIFIAMFKFVFVYQWTFPFYSIVFINFISFLTGLIYFIWKVIQYEDINKNIFYMSGIKLFLISIPYSGYMLCVVASLY